MLTCNEQEKFRNFQIKKIHARNCSLQPFIEDYDLASHITYVVCVKFIHKWPHLQFKVDFERQNFEKLFMAILFTFSVFDKKNIY